MLKKVKQIFRKFFHGSHHKINGFNLVIILIVLIVMAYHISLSNENVPKFTTNKNVQTTPPVFFRYPTSEKQKTIRKARQLGYADYRISTEGDKLRIIVTPKDFIQKNIKYRWILKRNIDYISGDLDGEINTDHQSTIELLIKNPDANLDTFLAIEIYREDKVKRGYVQVIHLKDDSDNIDATKNHLFKSTTDEKDNINPKDKKLRVFY